MAKEIVIDIIDGGVSVSSVVQTGDTVAVIKAKNLPEEWLSDSTYVYALISQGENQVLNLMQNETENSKTVKKCGVQPVFTADNKAFKIVIFGTNVEVGEDGTVSGSYRYVSAPVMVSVGEGLESLTAEILPDKNGYDAISSFLISLQSAVEAEKVRVANEGKREEAEEARAGAEEIRASAELERAKAEVERAEAESRRIESESTRADNEASRIDNEGRRLQNEETRMENETKRETAEAARAAAELGRSAMIEARHFDSFDEAYEFIDSIRNREQKIYKISYVGTAEEPDFIEWVIGSFNDNSYTPFFQTLIGIFGIQTRHFIEWNNDEHVQKWSAWRTIVDEPMLESRLESFADEFTIDVDQSYNANSENAQSGKAVAEAIAKIVNGSPEALDTLYELANALGNDENFSATVMEQIGKKADTASLEEVKSDIAYIKKALPPIVDLGTIESSKVDEINEEGVYLYQTSTWSGANQTIKYDTPEILTVRRITYTSSTSDPHIEVEQCRVRSNLTRKSTWNYELVNGTPENLTISKDGWSAWEDKYTKEITAIKNNIGDIETAIDGIIKIQNGILGVGVNE